MQASVTATQAILVNCLYQCTSLDCTDLTVTPRMRHVGPCEERPMCPACGHELNPFPLRPCDISNLSKAAWIDIQIATLRDRRRENLVRIRRRL